MERPELLMEAPGVVIQVEEMLPFLSQVRVMVKLLLKINSLVSFPSSVTVPPLEVKEVCL